VVFHFFFSSHRFLTGFFFRRNRFGRTLALEADLLAFSPFFLPCSHWSGPKCLPPFQPLFWLFTESAKETGSVGGGGVGLCGGGFVGVCPSSLTALSPTAVIRVFSFCCVRHDLFVMRTLFFLFCFFFLPDPDFWEILRLTKGDPNVPLLQPHQMASSYPGWFLSIGLYCSRTSFLCQFFLPPVSQFWKISERFLLFAAFSSYPCRSHVFTCVHNDVFVRKPIAGASTGRVSSGPKVA